VSVRSYFGKDKKEIIGIGDSREAVKLKLERVSI
jgi:hypothetical protein